MSEDGSQERSVSSVSNERLRLWLNFWRAVVISGIVGLVVAIAPPLINAQIQEKELEIVEAEKSAELDQQRLRSSQEYVKTFIEGATEENIGNRYRFTRYLSALTLEPGLKAGWKVLFEDAEKEKQQVETELAKLEGETGEEAKAEIAKLKRELQVTRSRSGVVAVNRVPLSHLLDHTSCPAESVATVTVEKVMPDEKPPSPSRLETAKELRPLLDPSNPSSPSEKLQAKRTLDVIQEAQNFMNGNGVLGLSIVIECLDESNDRVGDQVYFTYLSKGIREFR